MLNKMLEDYYNNLNSFKKNRIDLFNELYFYLKVYPYHLLVEIIEDELGLKKKCKINTEEIYDEEKETELLY